MKRKQRIGPYVYDADLRRLTQRGEPVDLRPKALALLDYLVSHQHRAVSHAELIAHIWPTTHAHTNNLFQVVSELRRALRPADPIATEPNIGYRWRPAPRPRPVLAVAAGIGVLAVAIALLSAPQTTPPDPALPPAYQAFYSGMDHLTNQNARAAAAQFELALAENPHFTEARVLLGQAYAESGQEAAARIVLDQLVNDATTNPDVYAAVSAMGLLGRMDQRAGRTQPALEWAEQAFERARESGFVCAALDLNERLIVQLDPTRTDDQALAEATGDDRCEALKPQLKSSAVERCDGEVEVLVAHDGRANPALKLS